MIATDPQTLLAAANCYQCFGATPYQLQLMKLALLADIVKSNNAMAATDPQSLLASANCYQCFASNPFMLQLMELALLNLVVQGGTGGGGSGQVQIYTDNTAPGSIAPPANKQAAAIAYSALGTSPTYTWSVTNQQWQ
jgi:hypothetical protein